MENMKRKENINIDALFGRLLDRQLFPWKNQQLTISETIEIDSQVEASETIDRLTQSLNIKAKNAIERIKGRAESWGYSKYLDHLWLKRIPHLRISFRA